MTEQRANYVVDASPIVIIQSENRQAIQSIVDHYMLMLFQWVDEKSLPVQEAASLASEHIAQTVEAALAGFIGVESPADLYDDEWAEFDVIDAAREWARLHRSDRNSEQFERAETELMAAVERMEKDE